MIDFILYIFIASGWIWGVWILFQEGHLFEKFANWWFDENTMIKPVETSYKWLENIAKPLFWCPVCMSSVHGLLWFFIGLPSCFHDALPIRMLIPFLLCLCGLNTILLKLTSKERKIVDE